MSILNWSESPGFVKATIWSANAIPPDFDYDFPIEMIDVAPLHAALSTHDSDSYSEYELAQVHDDELDHVDLSKPIIIDKRLPHQVADGMHRIMRAILESVPKLPSIDITPMFIELNMPEARNDYPPIVDGEYFFHGYSDDWEE